MNAEPMMGALFGLALFAFAGRSVLAWLPAGEPGRHRPHDLPTTWAASHLLGWIAFSTASACASELGLRFGPGSFALPFALLAIARIATLPAPMAPRHANRRRRPNAWSNGALFALAIALIALPVQAVRAGELSVPAGTDQLEAWRAARAVEAYILRLARPANIAALALILVHGLGAFDLNTIVRRTTALLVAALPAFWPLVHSTAPGQIPGHSDALLDSQLTLCFGAGLAFGAQWLRRADRRALSLSSIAFGACLGFGPAGWPTGLAGLLALALMLHPNAYRGARPWFALALLLAQPWKVVRTAIELGECTRADLELASASLAPEQLLRAVLDWRTGGPLWLVATLGFAAYVARHPQRSDRSAAWFLLQGSLLALVFHVPLAAGQECLSGLDRAGWPEALSNALPGAAALAALGFARSAHRAADRDPKHHPERA